LSLASLRISIMTYQMWFPTLIKIWTCVINSQVKSLKSCCLPENECGTM
jgi:hypothetical protein